MLEMVWFGRVDKVVDEVRCSEGEEGKAVFMREPMN
jgi:hypothetical protein